MMQLRIMKTLMQQSNILPLLFNENNNDNDNDNDNEVSYPESYIDSYNDSSKEEDTKKKATMPTKHKYGEYQNVLLSDDQLEKLQNEFPTDWKARIERVSEYCASSGKTYKDYLATIRSWAKKEKPINNKGNSSNPFLELLQEEIQKEGIL